MTRALLAEVVDVAGDAFAAPPWLEGPLEAQSLGAILATRLDAPGFRLVVARAAGGSHRLLGFGYGTDVLAGQLADRSPFVRGGFEVAELAVRAEAQGCGLGGRLHDHLVGHVRHPVAWLATRRDAPALAFYVRRHWHVRDSLRSATGAGGGSLLLLQRLAS